MLHRVRGRVPAWWVLTAVADGVFSVELAQPGCEAQLVDGFRLHGVDAVNNAYCFRRSRRVIRRCFAY